MIFKIFRDGAPRENKKYFYTSLNILRGFSVALNPDTPPDFLGDKRPKNRRGTKCQAKNRGVRDTPKSR